MNWTLIVKATKLQRCQCWASCPTFREWVTQTDGRPAVSSESTCAKVGLRETKNPSTLQHFVETLRPPNHGKDVASSGGNDWYQGRIYWQIIFYEMGLQGNETSCKFRHNSTSTFDWKASVGDGFLKYQNISFQGNLPELFFSKCQNAVNGHFQSEFLTFCFEPTFCI